MWREPWGRCRIPIHQNFAGKKNMNPKEEMIRLNKYKTYVKERQDAVTPDKWKHSEPEYRLWLQREFEFVSKKIAEFEIKDPTGGKLTK